MDTIPALPKSKLWGRMSFLVMSQAHFVLSTNPSVFEGTVGTTGKMLHMQQCIIWGKPP